MPKGVYKDFTCKGDVKHPPFVPQPHQQKTVDAFVNSPYKGMLLYHKLGSGKTCTTIMAGDRLINENKVKRIFILTPGSLRKGWLNEYCQICGTNNKNLARYTFITYNYMVGNRLPNFDYSLVIIDEVHNLINGVKNNSDTPVKIYNAIMNAKCRVLALSGTPIYNYIYEWPLLGNLLKPNTFPEIRTVSKRGKKGLDTFAFMKDFTVSPEGIVTPNNPTRFNRMLDGIISYYPGAGEEFMPKVIEQPIIRVRMSPQQEGSYWQAVATEQQFQNEPSEKLKRTDPVKYKLAMQLYIMAKKKVISRSASNFMYPANVGNIIPEEEPRDEKEEPKEEEKKPKVRDLAVKDGGWVDKKMFADGKLRLYSKKFVALLSNIILNIDQKHAVFTYYKEKGGVILLQTLLGMCGVKADVFTGDMNDEERGRVLRVFNSADNRHGERIKVLLLTDAGCEGISLMEVRHFHILESSTRFTKTNQAIGRVARFRSHINLPKHEQNVRVWRYWSVADTEPFTLKTKVYNREGELEEVDRIITDKTCIDEELYIQGLRNMNEVNSFMNLLQKNSILK